MAMTLRKWVLGSTHRLESGTRLVMPTFTLYAVLLARSHQRAFGVNHQAMVCRILIPQTGFHVV